MAGPKQGITSETRASSRVPFPIEMFYNKSKESGGKISPFPKAALTEVKAIGRPIKEDYKLLEGVVLTGNEKPTAEQVTPDSLQWSLDFQFESHDGVYEYQHVLFAPLDTDVKADDKERWNNDRIAHFYQAYMGANTAAAALSIDKVLNGAESTWENYYKGLATIFNTGNAGKPIFMNGTELIPVRIKLVRAAGGKNPNRVQMPLFGNVIEKAIAGALSSTLSIDPTDKFEIIAQAVAPGAAAGNRATFGTATAANAAGATNDEWADEDTTVDDTDL